MADGREEGSGRGRMRQNGQWLPTPGCPRHPHPPPTAKRAVIMPHSFLGSEMRGCYRYTDCAPGLGLCHQSGHRTLNPLSDGTRGGGGGGKVGKRGARAGEGRGRPPAAATETGEASGTEKTRDGPVGLPRTLPRVQLDRTSKGTPSLWAPRALILSSQISNQTQDSPAGIPSARSTRGQEGTLRSPLQGQQCQPRSKSGFLLATPHPGGWWGAGPPRWAQFKTEPGQPPPGLGPVPTSLQTSPKNWTWTRSPESLRHRGSSPPVCAIASPGRVL